MQFTQAVAVGTTSALAHALTGQAKTASMLLLSPMLYDEPTSARQLVGGAAAMGCLVVYVVQGEREKDSESGRDSYRRRAAERDIEKESKATA